MINLTSFTPAISLAILLLCACTNTDTSGTHAESETSAQQGEITVDGFPLKYIRKGEGAPFLVIGSAYYYSKAFSQKLEEKFELIYIDSRHFVPDCKVSETSLGELSLSTFSDDVEQIRQHLGLGSVGVIGHSVHAQIALDYAARYPEYTDKLVLICGVPYQGEDIQHLNDQHWKTDADAARKAKMENNMEILQTIQDTTPADKYFSLSYHYNAPIYWADPNFDATFLLNDLRTCPRVMGKLFGIIPSKEEVQAKVAQLSMPALLILGKLDFAIPYKAWEEVVDGKNHIKYVLMKEASHNPHTEPGTAGAFDQHLIAWHSTLE